MKTRFRMWADNVHAELNEIYDCGLGDLESYVDLGDLFNQSADAEMALRLAGMCFCAGLDGELCENCKEDETED